ncbi:MAG: hypothetical protein QOF76_3793 [Solirubrobacteraceae bacterium]|nr:hypothetical protein [Solirubrobacteraceae bacterium]
MHGTGLWSRELRYHKDHAELAEAAAELEELGYTALWYPGFTGGDVFGAARRLLDATTAITVAPGILNVWGHEPAEVNTEFPTLPERFLLGIGVGHPQATAEYQKPLQKINGFLDELDVPKDRMILAALGPKMLDTARERSSGAHPYFVPVAHTAYARERLGTGPVLAPECAVVLEADPEAARALARGHMEVYLGLTNYTNNLLRHGFDESDLADGGSDRLVDAIVAWGDDDVIAKRLQEHRDAGADHVCWQVIHAGDGLPLEEWRRLAAIG